MRRSDPFWWPDSNRPRRSLPDCRQTGNYPSWTAGLVPISRLIVSDPSGDHAPIGEAYGRICDQLTDPEVPKKAGFYLWGFYDKRKFWVNIYLGKAGNDAKGKFAHLRWRIREELMDERAFAWRAFTKEKESTVQLDYPRYRREVLRAINKAGSTHIFWVAVPSSNPANIKSIESDLIETLNPTGNRERNPPSLSL
jgi:hypothetical protein